MKFTQRGDVAMTNLEMIDALIPKESGEEINPDVEDLPEIPKGKSRIKATLSVKDDVISLEKYAGKTSAQLFQNLKSAGKSIDESEIEIVCLIWQLTEKGNTIETVDATMDAWPVNFNVRGIKKVWKKYEIFSLWQSFKFGEIDKKTGEARKVSTRNGRVKALELFHQKTISMSKVSEISEALIFAIIKHDSKVENDKRIGRHLNKNLRNEKMFFEEFKGYTDGLKKLLLNTDKKKLEELKQELEKFSSILGAVKRIPEDSELESDKALIIWVSEEINALSKKIAKLEKRITTSKNAKK